MMNISIVIPLYNEDESLPELTAWIDRVMWENKFSYELIFIDDGSTDDSWLVIERLKEKFQSVTAVKFRRNYGKSRSEEHTSELQSLMRISYAVFCLKKKNTITK